MNSDLEIEKLKISQISYLVNGFNIWYKKNHSTIDESYLFSLSMDMYQSDDTEIFSLKENKKIIGVFYTVESNEMMEVSGGLIESSKSPRNTSFVFDFCKNIALQKKITSINVKVLKKHYKYEALLRLYCRNGFILSCFDDKNVTLSYKLTNL